MFVDNFKDMFEDLGLFKCPLTTYNDEVLNSFISMSLHELISLSNVIWCKAWFQVLTFFLKYLSTYAPYNDDVTTMACVMDMAFSLGIYTMVMISVFNYGG